MVVRGSLWAAVDCFGDVVAVDCFGDVAVLDCFGDAVVVDCFGDAAVVDCLGDAAVDCFLDASAAALCLEAGTFTCHVLLVHSFKRRTAWSGDSRACLPRDRRSQIRFSSSFTEVHLYPVLAVDSNTSS